MFLANVKKPRPQAYSFFFAGCLLFFISLHSHTYKSVFSCSIPFIAAVTVVYLEKLSRVFLVASCNGDWWLTTPTQNLISKLSRYSAGKDHNTPLPLPRFISYKTSGHWHGPLRQTVVRCFVFYWFRKHSPLSKAARDMAKWGKSRLGRGGGDKILSLSKGRIRRCRLCPVRRPACLHGFRLRPESEQSYGCCSISQEHLAPGCLRP